MEWYVREETLREANTCVVNHHYGLKLSKVFGGGTMSSSDGQRFPVRGKSRTLPVRGVMGTSASSSRTGVPRSPRARRTQTIMAGKRARRAAAPEDCEAATMTTRITGDPADAPWHDVAFSPDGTLIAAAGNHTAVRVWQTATGALVHTLTGDGPALTWRPQEVKSVAFSPDGTLIAAAGEIAAVEDLRAVRVWQTATGAPVHTLTGTRGSLDSVAFSPDGTLIAAAGNDESVRVWDTATRAPVRALTGHTRPLNSVAFSPDGTLIAAAGYDSAVRVWQTAAGALVRTLTGHDGTVYSVAFSPDGTLIASAGDDRAVRVWDTAAGALVRALTGHDGRVYSVAFSPDGTLIASAGDDRDIRIWAISAGSGR